MKIYKYSKKGEPDEFYADDWSVEHKKTKILIFIKGQGSVSFPKKNMTEMEIEVAEKWSWKELHRLWHAYGKHVTTKYCEKHVPCAGICIPIYLVVAREATAPEVLDEIEEKTGFNIYKAAYDMAVYGVFLFPIVEFDDHLHKKHGYEEDKHGSMQEFITEKWGNEFAQRLEGLWKAS